MVAQQAIACDFSRFGCYPLACKRVYPPIHPKNMSVTTTTTSESTDDDSTTPSTTTDEEVHYVHLVRPIPLGLLARARPCVRERLMQLGLFSPDCVWRVK